MNDGTINKGRSVEDVRNSLAEDERGATEYDGIALFIMHKELFPSPYSKKIGGTGGIDLPGAQDLYTESTAAALGAHDGRYPVIVGRPIFGFGAKPYFGSATCGRRST